MKRAKYENIRHTNMLKQVNNHHHTVLKQWRGLRRLLTSQRSAWAERYVPGLSLSESLLAARHWSNTTLAEPCS